METASPVIYTLSLHDALPICGVRIDAQRSNPRVGSNPEHVSARSIRIRRCRVRFQRAMSQASAQRERSEEHTSELQSLTNLVCRLLLEKKNNIFSQIAAIRHV